MAAIGSFEDQLFQQAQQKKKPAMGVGGANLGGQAGGSLWDSWGGSTTNAIGSGSGALNDTMGATNDVVTPLPGTINNSGGTGKTYTVGDFQNRARTRYGREATPEELARFAQQVGYGGTGPLSEDQWTQATGFADELARTQGWKGAEEAPIVEKAKPISETERLAQERIRQLLGTQTGEVNTASKEYQGQVGSFKRSQSAAIEKAKRAAIARAQGQSGAADSALSQMDLAAAESTGDFEAQLAGQQLGRQREDLAQGLKLAQERGLAEQATSLQERLANLEATLKQRGLNLQGELGRGDLSLRKLLGLLQNSQANNRLGFDYTKLGLDNDNEMLRRLFGGL